jgi:hypothetical protein
MTDGHHPSLRQHVTTSDSRDTCDEHGAEHEPRCGKTDDLQTAAARVGFPCVLKIA